MVKTGNSISEKTKKSMKSVGRRLLRGMKSVGISLVVSMLYMMPAFAAASGETIIENGFDVIYGIIAAIVSSVGMLYLLWGAFEWAQSLNTQDGGAQSYAFKRIAGGLVAILVPQLIPIIATSAGA